MRASAQQSSDDHVCLESPPASPAQARDKVRALLTKELPRPPEAQRLNDLLLVVSELVTNAIRHGGGIAHFDVCLDTDNQQILLDVADHSTERPTTAQAGTMAPGGFGWSIITRLSTSITITSLPDGKNIRLTFQM